MAAWPWPPASCRMRREKEELCPTLPCLLSLKPQHQDWVSAILGKPWGLKKGTQCSYRDFVAIVLLPALSCPLSLLPLLFFLTQPLC